MPLDSNLIAVQWGLIGAFGIAVTLLGPKAEQYRHDFLETGEVRDRTRAEKWGVLVRRVPIAVLIAICGLSVIGAINAQLTWARGPWEQFSLLITPILAQIGFVYLMARLVPKLPALIPAKLMDVTDPLPASPHSVTQTHIKIANRSDRPLSVWWLDSAGALYAVLRVRPRFCREPEDSVTH